MILFLEDNAAIDFIQRTLTLIGQIMPSSMITAVPYIAAMAHTAYSLLFSYLWSLRPLTQEIPV